MRLPLILSLLLSGSVAFPTFALSCKPPNFANRFNEAAAAQEVYALFLGELVPLVNMDALSDALSAPYRLEGRQLGRAGFGEDVTVDLSVERTCAGSFCGPFPSSRTPLLVLVENRGAAMVVTSAPCGEDVFLTPSFGQVSAIRSCMRVLECGAEEIDAFAQD